MPQTELRGITLRQILDLGQLVRQVVTSAIIHGAHRARVSWDDVNMYHINENVVMPLTARFPCSWVELVALGPQPPLWFVSHWWGTAFQETAQMLKFHASRRDFSVDTSYWICTFANNQHDLSELGGSLQETPFVKAILASKCMGTLTLLDHHVTTFERIWCVLEKFVSSSWTVDKKASLPHLLDVAAHLPAGSGTFGGRPVPAKPTLRLDLGNGKMKEFVEDEASGGAFPHTVAAKGSRIDVFKAQASRPEDRRNILHLIAGTPEAAWIETDPPSSCDAYDDLNHKVRAVFAAGALYAAAARADIAELETLLAEFPGCINEGISDGATPLYAAAWKNHVEPLRMLLRARGDPNACKDDGASPLFIAAQAGQDDAIVELLSARGDPKLARDNVTPCFMAVQNQHCDALSALLRAAADPDIANSQGVTPLLLASQQGYEGLVKSLLAAQADTNRTTQNGNTPIRVAKTKTIIKSLLEANANAESVAPSAETMECQLTNISDGFAGLPDLDRDTSSGSQAKGKRKGRSSGANARSGVLGARAPAASSLLGMYAACEMEGAEASLLPSAGSSNKQKDKR